MSPIGREARVVDARSSICNWCCLVERSSSADRDSLVLGTSASHLDACRLRASGGGCIGNGHVHTLGCIGCSNGSGSDAIDAVVVGQRESHIASQVSASHLESSGLSLTNLGRHAQRGGRDGQRRSCGLRSLIQGHGLDITPSARSAIGVDSLHLVVEGGAGLEVAHGVVLVGDARDGASCSSSGFTGIERCSIARDNLNAAYSDVVAGRLDGHLVAR